MMYPNNPQPVHERIDDIFRMFDECKEDEQRHFAYLLNTVAQHHPKVHVIHVYIYSKFDKHQGTVIP